jgi:hypothetical protein
MKGNGSFENFIELISESQGESFYVCSNSRSVFMCLNDRSLTKKKHTILNMKIKQKLLQLKKHKKDIKSVWIGKVKMPNT